MSTKDRDRLKALQRSEKATITHVQAGRNWGSAAGGCEWEPWMIHLRTDFSPAPLRLCRENARDSHSPGWKRFVSGSVRMQYPLVNPEQLEWL
jgi:hypothetical protein